MTAMLRYKWTSFGPMLDEDGPFVLLVDAEAAIAATENTFRNAEGAWYRAGQEYGYNEGQRDAIAAAVQRVEEYVQHDVDDGWLMASEIIAAIKGDQP